MGGLTPRLGQGRRKRRRCSDGSHESGGQMSGESGKLRELGRECEGGPGAGQLVGVESRGRLFELRSG